MKILRLIRSNIPNTITCLNLLSGCIATVFAFHYDSMYGNLTGYEMAFIFIGAATVFDFCDGLSARLLHAYSALGKELDSLSDLVSFGLAPAVLIYSAMTANGAGWASFLAFAVTVFGALRLAKFNIDDRQTSSFIGLPIPSNAIFWIGWIAWINSHTYPGDAVMILLIVVVSALMVSRMRMFSMKVKTLEWRSNVRRYALLIGAVLFLIMEQLSGLAWTIVLYVVLSATARKNEQY